MTEETVEPSGAGAGAGAGAVFGFAGVPAVGNVLGVADATAVGTRRAPLETAGGDGA